MIDITDIFPKKAKEVKSASTPPAVVTTVFDGAEDQPSAAANHANASIAQLAVAVIQQWAETTPEELDDGESLADRLESLFVGIADEDMDGEIGDAELTVINAALEAAWDYLLRCEIPEDDITTLLNDFDDDVGIRVHEMLISKLPEGEDAAGDDMDDFVFGDGSDESVLDEAALDATYKKKIVWHGGKKMRIRKHISGFVKRTAKQKIAFKKVRMKSHRAGAQLKRMKSMRARKRATG